MIVAEDLKLKANYLKELEDTTNYRPHELYSDKLESLKETLNDI